MKTALLLQYMIRNDITFGFTSKSCVTRMAGQDIMLYPGACSFVCLAGTSLQALRIGISADLVMRDSHSPAECFLMRDSHSPAEYFQKRLSLFQDSHTLSKAHLDAFSMLRKSYSPAECLLPSWIMIE